MTILLSDGSDGPTIDMRPLFDQYDYERKGT